MNKSTSYVLDGAPITVRGSNVWSSKVFNKHLPVLYFYQLLESINEGTTIAPVIDVVRQGGFSELEEAIRADFNRRTDLSNLCLFDEAMRKSPSSQTMGRYLDFLNILDSDYLRSVDAGENLMWDRGGVVGLNGRLSCTLAEVLMYHDKIERHPLCSNLILLTGYDLSYLGLYGQGTPFRERQAQLQQGLSNYFGRDLGVISFLYATNPKGLRLIEQSREFATFGDEEREKILLSNTLYVLATAFIYQDRGISNITSNITSDVTSEIKELREKCRDYGGLSKVKELVVNSPIRNQDEFNGLAERAYHLLF